MTGQTPNPPASPNRPKDRPEPAGVKRPDQKAEPDFARKAPQHSTGGEGAAGAGGPDGFGG